MNLKHYFYERRKFMKKLLIGLLALGSISAFAQDFTLTNTVTLELTAPLENTKQFISSNGTSGHITCIGTGLSKSGSLIYNLSSPSAKEVKIGTNCSKIIDLTSEATINTPVKIIIKNGSIAEVINQK